MNKKPTLVQYLLSGKRPTNHYRDYRPHSRQVTGARCTNVAARQSRVEYSSRPTTGDEQRWVRRIQCLVRKSSCVYFQFQFHTQIAYKPTHMTYNLCYILLFITGTDIKFHRTIPFCGTLAFLFHFRQGLRVCAVKIGASYFDNLFSTCQQVLGHACHIWYSLRLRSLTHSH